MKEGFRQSMAWLHSWMGLLPGWVLFVIFLFGSTAFFQQEISRWMRPEMSGQPLSVAALDTADALLRNKGANAANWTITLPEERLGDPVSIEWTPAANSTALPGKGVIDPGTGKPAEIRDTLGGWFLYRFHFDLHYMPWWLARYIVCISALAMLIAILSGVITHKKIFTDFFLLRFGKGQRSWLDGHNVTGVLALPFHLMMTYTGLVTLLFTLMPWAITANFSGEDAFYQASTRAPIVEASGKPAPVLPLRLLSARAETLWHGQKPVYIGISNPGDAQGIAEIWPVTNGMTEPRRPLYLNAATGALVAMGPESGPAEQTERVMIQLHRGSFAAPMLRWLYFLSGVTGTIMVASGLVLWTVKRRAKLPDPDHPYFGFRLVERLNIGFITGPLTGIAIYFLANRLLPLGLEHRADWEVNSLFIGWGAVFPWTIARPVKQAWVGALTACAALYLLVPIINAATTGNGLLPSLLAGNRVFIAFDSIMLAVSAALFLTARKVAAHRPKAAPRRRTAPKVAAEISA